MSIRISVGKLQESEELRINIDIKDFTDLKTNAEVVYKPAILTQNDGKWNQKFQSLKPSSQAEPKDSLYLHRTNFFANILAFAAGVGFSWTSPVFPKLQGPESPLNVPIDASQEGIIASIICVGAALGTFPFGYLADKIGRKRTLLLIAVPMVVALVMLAFTDDLKMYYLARFIYGTGSGGVFTVLTMYLGEITEDHNRGKLCCLMGVYLALGLLYPFPIGPMLSVRNFCLSCLLPLQVFLIFFSLYCPESPSYLIKQDKIDLAVTVLKNLRGKSEHQIQAEDLKYLQAIVENQKHEKGGIAELFRTKSTRKAFMVSAGLLIIQQFSGINVVMGFMENIFLAAGGSVTVPPQVATTFIGVIQVLSSFVPALMIEKFGNKFLFISSIIGSACSLILLGLYFFFQRNKFSFLAYFWWVPIASLFVYIISYNLGIGPIPWTVLSEIFPNNVKASASALASSTNFSVSFVVTMAFPLISEFIGMAESFWIFGVCCILGLIFTYYVVPETKGKTLAEIQHILGQ